MNSKKTTTKNLKPINTIGEEIPPALGKTLITNYQTTHNEINSFTVGKDILLKILNHPDCQGIKIYNAINENSENTLVFAGIDKNGLINKDLCLVDSYGKLNIAKSIIADRVRPNNTNIDLENEDNFWEFV